ncbi:Transglutaminase-like enzyme, putative cysteine protease [Methylophaga frappieri]|uniref:Transglutaminase-like enzyme, putative cysteine protease n=1 Tax=Methylophaga frappieri (strain ATCC BAA-2434 / DSM 25690 / JAM7) TaxID=754477 RepID=I1YFX5_METFJ|nr:DUF3488 and transglutaminase-like domain-containing protein [Methylophaga frappieri]AFJ01818.1 Transglutaminase-like enzyme, putative cysteine protease [Methylophaga frappieri]
MIAERIPDNTFFWLMATLAIIAVPHFVYQPFWVTGLFAIMMGWRLAHHYRQWPLPADKTILKWLHGLAAVLTIILMLTNYGMTIGRDAGVALLTVMLAFKVVEINNRRDFYLVCFLGFFLITTHFFYNQSMLMVMGMIIMVMLLIASLIQLNQPQYNGAFRLKYAGILLLQALPVMLVLFLLFPRIPGPIWGLPETSTATAQQLPDGVTFGEQRRSSGSTGMSEQLQMGRISDVILSDAIAFRVAFVDEIPPMSERYWRGPVLWQTDGADWRPLAKRMTETDEPRIYTGQSDYSYTVTIEPHDKHWLFALDMPVNRPSGIAAQFSADGLLSSRQKITRRSQFSLKSHTQYRFNPEFDSLLDAALQLPDDAHPQTRQLAQRLLAESNNQRQFIENVLAHFNTEPFYYTLSPALLQDDIVDDFLFNAREGFCEHYAASFTVLMRAAGVPARIVTGYQGGEINPVDDVMVIRQRDAHAWVEVWLPEAGWVRVDPTAAVSPERVEQGIDRFLPENRRSTKTPTGSEQLAAVWSTIKNNWAALNNTWDIWIVGYGPGIQKSLLSQLGMQQPDWRKMAFWLALFLGIFFVMIAVLMHWHRPSKDPVSRYYQLFCRRLARLGIHRQPAEGPTDFAERAGTLLPAEKQAILTISDHYRRLRYREDRHHIDQFVSAVKAFRPSR